MFLRLKELDYITIWSGNKHNNIVYLYTNVTIISLRL